MNPLRTWARINSPWAIHFNSGSCNGCDIEILATLTPRYDLERFGIKLQGSPRHADVLICTGPVTRQARDRLMRIYEQMPDPKFVVAVGSCGHLGRRLPGLLQRRRQHRRGHPGERLSSRAARRGPRRSSTASWQLLNSLKPKAARTGGGGR